MRALSSITVLCMLSAACEADRSLYDVRATLEHGLVVVGAVQTSILAEGVEASPPTEPSGDWRTSTVLIGPLSAQSLSFDLPRGPEVFTVPLSAFSGREHQRWDGAQTWRSDSSFLATQNKSLGPQQGVTPREPAVADAPLIQTFRAAPGWFSARGLRQERQYQRTK